MLRRAQTFRLLPSHVARDAHFLLSLKSRKCQQRCYARPRSRASAGTPSSDKARQTITRIRARPPTDESPTSSRRPPLSHAASKYPRAELSPRQTEDDIPDSYENDPLADEPQARPSAFRAFRPRDPREPDFSRFSESDIEAYMNPREPGHDEVEDEDAELDMDSDVSKDQWEQIRADGAAQTAFLWGLISRSEFLEVPEKEDQILLKAWTYLYQVNAYVGRSFPDPNMGPAFYRALIASKSDQPLDDLSLSRIVILRLVHAATYLFSKVPPNSKVWDSKLAQELFGTGGPPSAAVPSETPTSRKMTAAQARALRKSETAEGRTRGRTRWTEKEAALPAEPSGNADVTSPESVKAESPVTPSVQSTAPPLSVSPESSSPDPTPQPETPPSVSPIDADSSSLPSSPSHDTKASLDARTLDSSPSQEPVPTVYFEDELAEAEYLAGVPESLDDLTPIQQKLLMERYRKILRASQEWDSAKSPLQQMLMVKRAVEADVIKKRQLAAKVSGFVGNLEWLEDMMEKISTLEDIQETLQPVDGSEPDLPEGHIQRYNEYLSKVSSDFEKGWRQNARMMLSNVLHISQELEECGWGQEMLEATRKREAPSQDLEQEPTREEIEKAVKEEAAIAREESERLRLREEVKKKGVEWKGMRL